jgi:hypothetical protein
MAERKKKRGAFFLLWYLGYVVSLAQRVSARARANLREKFNRTKPILDSP